VGTLFLKKGESMMKRTHTVRNVDKETLHYRLGWLAAIGFGLISLGMLAFYAPFYSGFSLQDQIGSYLLIGGAMFVAHAIRSLREARFVPEFQIGFLYLLFAFLIWGYATPEGHTLTLLLSIFFGLEAIYKIYFSLRLRPGMDWTWALVSGIVSAFIGAAIWGVPPATPLIGVMVGFDLLHGGLATIMIGHAMRKTLEKGEIFCVGPVCFSGL
jgi:uncharacterized membrane protein HdeD (DUF308 family)